MDSAAPTITRSDLDRFLHGVKGQALREGTRYAREARVGPFEGGEAARAVVEGSTGAYDVVLSVDHGEVRHSCSCPSWRSPCKHVVAASLVLRQGLPSGNGKSPSPLDDRRPAFDEGDARLPPEPDPAEVRERAFEERRLAARREKLVIRRAEPPFLEVESSSEFVYRVHVRGGPDGPHGCTCPDFEANRLHTCKHVERARSYLRNGRTRLPATFRKAAMRARVYLHFGEDVEPRLLGRPTGRGAPRVRAAFDDAGRPRQAVDDWRGLARWLKRLGSWVEPEALAWLERGIQRTPRLPKASFDTFVPKLGLTPYEYQWQGAHFLARRGRALLADEMGLGKTVQAIVAAVALRRARPAARRVTIVCPASLRGGWRDEIARWIGEEATLLEGGAPARAEVIASRPAWLITHFEQVLRDFRRHREHAPDLLIIDEAQRAKGLQTRTARTLKAIDARYVFALTGTPLENRLEEAYAIAQLIDQRLLPPLWQLDRDHFVRDDKGRQVLLYRNLDALRSRLNPAFLRRRKEDVQLQLPDRVRTLSSLPMHPAVEPTYADVMYQVMIIANKKVILPADLERMMRLLIIARRCCNGPHLLGMEVDDGKVPKLRELEQILKDLVVGEGRKAVVFSEWTDMTDRVEAMCRRLEIPVSHLRGDVPVRVRPGLIRSFSNTEGAAVFISTDAGGLGLNLQKADVLINLDLPWNPAKLEQRIARVHRIGSKRTVQVILLVCTESIEEGMLRLHEIKRNVFENVFAEDGEDVIEAPGGSGKFRDMVRALLDMHGPVGEGDGAGRPPHSRPAATRGEGDGADGGATEKTRPVRSKAHAPPSAAEPPAEPPPAVPESAPPVDPAAVAAAVAAVAPTLPPDHRRSLATVFRALAEALDGDA